MRSDVASWSQIGFDLVMLHATLHGMLIWQIEAKLALEKAMEQHKSRKTTKPMHVCLYAGVHKFQAMRCVPSLRASMSWHQCQNTVARMHACLHPANDCMFLAMSPMMAMAVRTLSAMSIGRSKWTSYTL